MEPFIYRSRLEKVRGKPTWHAWFEMLLITAISIYLSALSRPEDPFFMNAPFPWPAVGPLLVGLRYGFFFGFFSVLIELACIAMSIQMGWWVHEGFPYDYAIGLTAVAMLVGEFRDVWGRRIERLQESNDYRQVRLNEFTRNYHLLKVSHDRLEQQVAGSGHSLREGLRFVRKKMSAYSFKGISSDVAQSLLAIMSEYGNLQRAAMFVARKPSDVIDVYDEEGNESGQPDSATSLDVSAENTSTKYTKTGSKLKPERKKYRSILKPEPIAKMGFSRHINHNDPLIERCLQSQCLVSIRPEFADAEFTDSQLLACVPLIDAEGQVWAVVAVELMPFFSFQEKTLRLLAVLAGHMADLVNQHSQVGNVYEEEVARFNLNLKRALHDEIEFGIPSAIIVFDVEESDLGLQFISLVRRMQRGLDILVEQHREGLSQIVMLLPLTDELGVEGYRQRMDDIMKSETGTNLTEAPVTMFRHFLKDQTALDLFTQQRIWNGHQVANTPSNTV